MASPKIQLKRTALLEQLEQLSRAGSLLVVGGPGTGKTWLLRKFAAQREAAGDAAPLLLAEEHNHVESLSQLDTSLNLRAGLIPTLKAYPGTNKFLVIDSLDSLRAEAAQRVFRQLISTIHSELPDWRVVASIRSFDAKESLELQRLFPKANNEEGSGVIAARHLNVPVFDTPELVEAAEQDNRLVPIFQNASAVLLDILRNAFNLWLLIHLLDEKVEVDWLYSIESEVQLFERYWHYRVTSRSDRHDRVSILTNITSAMVKTRTLSLPLSEAYKTPGLSDSFQSLLSDEILRQTETQRITYTHNVLFDFSVTKLLLDEQDLIRFVADPFQGIFCRPSVSYFLLLLWYANRNQFWNVTSRFLSSESTLPARLSVLPGMAMLHCVTKSEDLKQLWELPNGTRVNAILSILRAAQAFDALRTPRAHLWMSLLYEISGQLDLTFINEYLGLMSAAFRQDTWTPGERQRLSEAAIRLLKWMWSEAESPASADRSDQLLSIAAGRVIPLVAQFYGDNVDNVKSALRIVLDRIGRPDVSTHEAYALANNIEPIIRADTAFAVEIYADIFAYKEKSQAPTQIGASKVLVLRSTRAQDYSMAYYILGVKFRGLLDQDIKAAARAAIRSVSAEVRREHLRTTRGIERYSTSIMYAGIKSTLQSDRSELWDQSYREDEGINILRALLGRIVEDLKNQELNSDSAWSVFRVIANENTFPVVWKRLIELASQNPELIPFTKPLLESPTILCVPETTVAAGALLSLRFGEFTADEKQKIEEAIWSIPSVKAAKIYRNPGEQRDRLLGCLPVEELSQRSREAVEAAKSTRSLAPNKPLFEMKSGYRQLTHEDFLHEYGIDTNLPANRQLLDAQKPLAEFASKYLNAVPALADIESITGALQSGFEAVVTLTDAQEGVTTDVLTSVAAVAACMVKNKELAHDSRPLALSLEIVRYASTYPYPYIKLPEKAVAQFETAVWSPTPKIEAAQALMRYVSNWQFDAELTTLIDALSKDSSPAVRFQIASGLAGLYKPNRDLFWRLAQSMLEGERATAVLVTLVQCVGQAYIAQQEPQKVIGYLKQLLKRPLPKGRPQDLSKAILDSLSYLYIYLNEPTANQLLQSLEKSPTRSEKQLRDLAMSASYYLDYKVGETDALAAEIRMRAREVELRVLNAIDRGLQLLETKLSPKGKRDIARRRAIVGELLGTVEGLVSRLHLIVKSNPELVRPDEESLSHSAIATFFHESLDLWGALVNEGSGYRRPVGPSTAHYLMESFNRLLPINPTRVLKLVWLLITGYTFGYQFDEMAIGEFVKFADRLLADDKNLLSNDDDVIRFSEVLDVFVKAGWPQATEIVFKLDAAVR
jgi:hypothetical protein